MVYIDRGQLNATGGQDLRVHKMVLTALSKKDLLHKSQALLLPNSSQGMVLGCKIKARRSVVQHRGQSAPSEETQPSSNTGFLSENQKNICSLTGKALRKKKKICFYYKYIFKIQYFLLAGFLNDDSNLFSDFSYAEKKVSIAKIRLHESLHQSFYVQKHIKGLQGV